MPEDKNALDELFRHSLEKAELPAPPGVWEGIAAGIEAGAAAGASTTVTSWFSMGWIKASVAIVALGGAAIGGWALLKEKETTTSPLPMVRTESSAKETVNTPATSDLESAVSVNADQPAKPERLPASGRKGGETSQSSHQGQHTDNKPQVGHGGVQPLNQNPEPLQVAPETHAPQMVNQDPCAGLPAASIVYREVQPGVADFSVGEGNWQQVRWNFGDGLQGSGNEVRHTFLSGKRFQVTLELLDEAGCLRRAEREIVLNGSELEGNILIPNVFTPNADGINDPYRILIVGQEKYRLSIYDRAGKVLYTGTDPEEGWDGAINGQPAPMGPYIARVEWQFYGHQPQNKTVVIMLKR